MTYDVHRLRLLRELHHRGTLAAVAEALGFNPSTVSQQLAKLEREVGMRLLEPIGRRVRLTAAADVLVDHAERIVFELEQAEAEIAALRTHVAGSVKIATFQSAAHRIIPAALTHVARSHPDVVVTVTHLHAEAALPGLLARDFDLVLHEEYPDSPTQPSRGTTTEPLLTDPMWLAVPVGWAARGITDLAGAPWIFEPETSRVRTWAVNQCRAAGFEPRAAFESTDVLLHHRMVSQGLAAAFLPGLAVEAQSSMRLIGTGQLRTINLAIRTGSGSNPALAAIRDALIEAARRNAARDDPFEVRGTSGRTS